MSEPADPPAPRQRAPLREDDGRLVRGRASRARIRAAAAALFRDRGFDATTLRAIADRAGMGTSSIYRHVQSKEELLIQELADLQEEAWERFRRADDRAQPVRERVRNFLDAQHVLLTRDPDLTTIALRAVTQPESRAARQSLAVQDRTMGLVAEILLQGRARGELHHRVDVLAGARAVVHVAQGARLAWANGLIGPEDCRASIENAVGLLFTGLE